MSMAIATPRPASPSASASPANDAHVEHRSGVRSATDLQVDIAGLGKEFHAQGRRIVALNDVTLSVRRGQFCCLVGPSGCGKSTLLRIIAGLETHTSGTLGLAHFDRSKPLLSMVFQEQSVFPWMTVERNVAMPLLIRGTKVAVAAEAARAMLARVGLEKRLQHKPAELSGGERQRVAIARALVAQPLCVLLDEPTGNLDRGTADTIHALMLDLNREFETSFIVVTHDPLLAQRMDRVLHLRDGALAAL